MKKKTFILTIDYEVFLGNRSGDLQTTLIDPTYRLMKILDKNNSKMTVFWDVLHYYRISELSDKYPELINEKIMIENQIRDLVLAGHDIQLHLHPHWIDTVYQDGKWFPNYKRFSLHKLSTEKIGDDINTIYGCVNMMKNLMEDFIRPLDNDYCVTSFRAGGYLIEPFSLLKEVFLEFGIIFDSSTCPGAYSYKKEYGYDFRKYPKLLNYSFDETPKHIKTKGRFTEFPIYMIQLPFWFRLFKFIHRKFNISKTYSFTGTGVNFETTKPSKFKHIINQIFYNGRIQLSADGHDTYTFKYCITRSPQHAVMILHPKMLNDDSFQCIDKLMKNGTLEFITLHKIIDVIEV
ncbi:MAG: hypothetical protein PHU68_04630 [Paludibacter sp.]|nr:hypothetical protein [Paludibacter sp.]